MEYRGPIIDTHFHLDIENRGLQAVERFASSGGTHLILVHKPPLNKLPRKEEDFLKEFKETISLLPHAKRYLKDAWLVLGIHPVVGLRIFESSGEEAYRILDRGVRVLGRVLDRTVKVVGVGEIGRPHFPVSDAALEATDYLFDLQVDLARERGLPVVLHTEGYPAKKDIFEILKGFLEERKFPLKKAVKHFSSGSSVGKALEEGFSVSVVARERDFKRALKESPGGEFMLESDYLDDPERPDKVIPPDQIPRLVKAFFEGGLIDEDVLGRILVEKPLEVYGVDVE